MPPIAQDLNLEAPLNFHGPAYELIYNTMFYFIFIVLRVRKL